MKTKGRVETFRDKYPFLGPALWVVNLQYFIVTAIVALNWPRPYSFSRNTISDLGNTACGIYGGRYVCSPLHEVMNVSFIILGLSMALGSLLIYFEFRRSMLTRIAFSLMALGGLGTLMVGVFPENVAGGAHLTGAVLALGIGNIAILLFGLVLGLSSGIRTYTIISATVALIGFAFFGAKHYLFLGEGGMERLAAYPQTLWLIVFGYYIRRDHFKRIAGSLVHPKTH